MNGDYYNSDLRKLCWMGAFYGINFLFLLFSHFCDIFFRHHFQNPTILSSFFLWTPSFRIQQPVYIRKTYGNSQSCHVIPGFHAYMPSTRCRKSQLNYDLKSRTSNNLICSFLRCCNAVQSDSKYFGSRNSAERWLKTFVVMRLTAD